MTNQDSARQLRRKTARSMAALALGGITTVIAIAVMVVWFNWPGAVEHTAEADPMSKIG